MSRPPRRPPPEPGTRIDRSCTLCTPSCAESTPICEYIEDLNPEPPLIPKDAKARYEMRRLVSWFDDKFHHEVTSNLLYERVNKKVSGQGFPDSKNIKEGARKIKYHLDYMAWLLEHRRWLAGDTMTLADFAAAAHLSSLDYISDVDWNRSSVDNRSLRARNI